MFLFLLNISNLLFIIAHFLYQGVFHFILILFLIKFIGLTLVNKIM